VTTERHTGGRTKLQPISIKVPQSCESGLKEKYEVEVTKTLFEDFRKEMFGKYDLLSNESLN
jgi:hypothetical protein